jgi:hypothetical protein
MRRVDVARSRVFENGPDDWWTECLICGAWVSTSNASRRVAEQKFGRHMQEDHAAELLPGYATPELAVLASFSSAAGARVVSLEWIDPRHVSVVVDTAPSHPVTCDCHQGFDRLWRSW